MATMKNVAEKAGVSTSTVSHVINGTRYVSPELKEKVEKVMEELDYSPHAAARSLRSQKTHTVAFVASDITNAFMANVARGIEEVANQKDYQLIIANTDEDQEKEVVQLKGLLYEERVDGLVISPTGKSREEFEQFDDLPIVFVDRAVPGVEADTVLAKNVEGAYKLTNHLIERGHERIGIVLGLKNILTSSERLEGYRKALQGAGLGFDESLVRRGNFKAGKALEATKELLELNPPPTAIFTVNNKTTDGALQAIKESKFNWPEDIEIGGFDDLDCLSFMDLPLTTVVQKPKKMGIEAANLLYSRIDGEKRDAKTTRISVELVTRD